MYRWYYYYYYYYCYYYYDICYNHTEMDIVYPIINVMYRRVHTILYSCEEEVSLALLPKMFGSGFTPPLLLLILCEVV